MIKRLILSIALCSASVTTLSALEITVSPGSLRNEIAALRNTRDTDLTLNGSADVTDLALLKEMSRSITRVDINGLEIVEYNYPPGEGDYMGQTKFAAGEIPAAMLIGGKVEEFIFPASASKIGESAFASCNVKNVIVPAGVTQIGNNAWSNCSQLLTVSIPSETALGTGIFKNCPALTNVTFGFQPTSIPTSTFDGCKSLISSLPESVKAVGAYAYRGTALQSLNLSNVETVGDFAFAEMPHLSEITLNSDNDILYGKGVFFGDSGLDQLPAVGYNTPALLLAHSGGNSMLTVNSAVIGEGAYANNSALKSLVLGESVSDIKAHAFRNATNLETVNASVLGANIPSVDSEAFSGLENDENRYNAHLIVKKDTEDLWEQHSVWSRFSIMTGGSDVGVVQVAPVNARVARNGDSVSLESSSDIEWLAIYSIDGKVIYEGAPKVAFYTVSDIDPSIVVLVKVECGNSMKIVKLAPTK